MDDHAAPSSSGRTSAAAVTGVVLALPGLALAVSGYFHPEHLTAQTAHRWWTLHVPGMFAFILVGVALIALFRGRRDPVAWIAVLASFAYLVFYNALDVLSGIGAGFVTSRLAPGASRPDEVRSIFAIGTPMGEIGSWALILAAVVVAGDALVRHRLVALPGLLLVPGAVLVHVDHIYWPQGALGMALVGLATGWLGFLLHRGTKIQPAGSPI